MQDAIYGVNRYTLLRYIAHPQKIYFRYSFYIFNAYNSDLYIKFIKIISVCTQIPYDFLSGFLFIYYIYVFIREHGWQSLYAYIHNIRDWW